MRSTVLSTIQNVIPLGPSSGIAKKQLPLGVTGENLVPAAFWAFVAFIPKVTVSSPTVLIDDE